MSAANRMRIPNRNLDTADSPSDVSPAESGHFDAPPVVSKRNHFLSAECLINCYFDRFLPEHPPRYLRTERVRAWLLKYTEDIIGHVAQSFAVGAQRGIEQTAKLLCDPDYYRTLKERRLRDSQRQKEYEAEQEAERLERELAPTGEQIEREISNLEKWIPDTESDLERMRERLKALRAMTPKHVRMPRRETE